MLPGALSFIFFLVELAMLVIMLINNRHHPFFWTICVIMVLLQVYQLIEFLICQGISVNITGRLAFTAISFLPPTGYYLSAKMVGWKHKDYLFWFGIGIAFSLFFILSPVSIVLVDCNPFYAVYAYPLGDYYGIFYFANIFLAIALIAVKMKKKQDPNVRSKSWWTILGYLSFLIPMGLFVFFINVPFGTAVPSIMCKYAIVVAILLFVYSFQYDDKIVPSSFSNQ